MQAQAQNRPPYIEFHLRAEEDRDETIKTGIYKTKDVEFVTIMPAGDTKLKIDRQVDEWLQQTRDKVRQGNANPEHLAYFENAHRAWKQNQEIPVSGIPIKTWPALSPSQVQNLLSSNIRTIEDLAAANEDALLRIGMGGRALKERAIAHLAAANGVSAVAEENAALKAGMSDMRQQIAELTALITQLSDRQDGDEAEGAPRRGRPPGSKNKAVEE
jgi:hypothetical protein